MAHKKGSKCGCKHGGKKRCWVSYVHVVKQLPKENLKYTHLHTLTPTVLRYVKVKSKLVVRRRLPPVIAKQKEDELT